MRSLFSTWPVLAVTACATPAPTAPAPAPDAEADRAAAMVVAREAVVALWEERDPLTLPPDFVKPCPVSGDDLRKIMSDGVGPLMSQTSYLIHHDPREPHERMPSLAEASAAMLACVQQVGKIDEHVPAARVVDHYEFLYDLELHTHALFVSASEFDPPGVQHWFGHVRYDCSGCHAQFRPQDVAGEPSTARSPGG